MTLDLALPPTAGPVGDAPVRWQRARPVRWATYVCGVVAGAGLLLVILPIVSGAPWRSVSAIVVSVPSVALTGLLVLWLAGLVAHTVTLTAALPGLSHGRALLLSLTGSAVANVLPLGGVAGVALNYRMTRRWGFTPGAFASYTVVTNLWDVVSKLLLPVLVVPLLVLGLPVSAGLRHLLVGAVIALPLVGALASAVIARPSVLGRLGDRAERLRAHVAGVVRSAWQRLSIGMAAYLLLLFALLATCLSVTGAGVALPFVLIGFCVERLTTLAGLTPGGLGLVEVGLAGALLLAPGADPAGVAAGTLLYRALTFGLEIPVGGLLLAGWTWRQRVAA
ncbi:MAG TPA: lysylphosphatidylglycerol synthase domain-containing protein [Nocardioides sp.]|uniref:lysylphosphatidylglycerol synthase domain-containing protein n=1 Tax=Nocardioides sp. TaxID=35761 RepID=UPI002E311B2C|nr:lysylphosphatidylglycerol synthase domain-containing protein [Nocardioides sp.]HEX5087626.1 lysylphosphatidylglycerol synthase domain-containing protein [Nocardioides sp.]